MAKKGSVHFDLLELFKGETCPVCRLASRHVARYLDTISYEAVNDIQTRDKLRAALGFCPTHAWHWLNLHNALGTAIIYKDVLTELIRRLDSLSPPKVGGFFAARGRKNEPDIGLSPSGPCPACEVRDESFERSLDTFTSLLGDSEFVEEYQKSRAGLCLSHLRAVLSHSHEPQFSRLVAIEKARLEFTVGQLDELIRKYDYRFREEAVGDEAGAPTRAVKRLAGMEKLLAPATPLAKADWAQRISRGCVL